jgi:hypothetical protein
LAEVDPVVILAREETVLALDPGLAIRCSPVGSEVDRAPGVQQPARGSSDDIEAIPPQFRVEVEGVGRESGCQLARR